MRKIKVLAVVLMLIITLQSFTVTTFASNSAVEETESSVPFVPVYKEGSYGEYLQTYSRAAVPDEIVEIDIHSYIDASENVTSSTVAGRDNILVTEELGYVEYEVDIPVSGLYAIGTTYYPIKGKGAPVEREILINGENPYNEARSISLDRMYKDDVEDPSNLESYFMQDVYGNQLRTSQVEAPAWIENSYFKDSTAYYNGPLKFYLEKGKNIIRFESVRESCAFERIYLYGAQTYQSYTDFLMDNAMLNSGGDKIVQKAQGEYPYLKSDPMLYATYDRSSPATEPASTSAIKLNIIGGTGGDKWKVPGQWVEYKVDIETAGLYKIILRARQNSLSGSFVSREITVNGETPFEEAANVRFNYNSNWQMVTPKDQYQTPLLFKFNAGENIIRIKAVTGDMTDIINAADAVIAKLNSDYRKILALTGPKPDIYRDYDFDIEIPEVIADLKAQGDILMSIFNKMVSIIGERGQQTAVLYNILNNLYKMYEDTDEISELFETFKKDIGNLGSWLITMRNQPLELDYVLVAEENAKDPKAEKGIFAGLWHQTVMFVSSFFTDVNAISGTSVQNYEKEATVWTSQSRDHAQILRQIIDRSFIQQHEIKLDLALVPGGALLPSILAGIGPDVNLNVDSGTVVNYASRNALQSLNDFEGFNEVKKRFSETAFVSNSIEVDDGVILHYGLPETQSFPVLFYREDVLAELGQEVPRTWEDVYELIPVLQKRFMDYAPPDFNTLLYQYGGSLYKEGDREVNIDSELAIDTFIEQTDFFTAYKCPVEYNFVNRFRFGEMPIGMQDYLLCNQLSIFAPEIRGLWKFTTIPGVQQEDGTINNLAMTNVSSAVMLAGAEDKDSAWEFMKWWTDAPVQVEYGRELESLLGSAARYGSANKEAVYSMPWRADEIDALMEQWDNLVGYPEKVGGYALTRYMGFAHTNVVVDFKDPRETILDYVKLINEEIRYKRNELGLPVD